MKSVVKGLLLVVFSLLFVKASYAQSHGLIFSSFEVVQEKRTSLDLGAGTPQCLGEDFELAFDLSFLPEHPAYFGYVFRLINARHQNIDLLYSPREGGFNVVFGESMTGIGFKIDSASLADQWHSFKLRVNKGEISFQVNGKLVSKAKVELKDDCFRIVFGACNEPEFKSTDLPPMQVRNISIAIDQETKYFWPLRETKGYVSIDSLRDKKANVTNPIWITPLYQQWQSVYNRTVKGNAAVAFDAAREEVVITAKDSIYRFPVKNGTMQTTAILSPEHFLLRGSLSFVQPETHQLYNFYLDKQWATPFREDQQTWEQPFPSADVTEYWHANKFYFPAQGRLYILGGYGQLTYKNKVHTYNFISHKWDSVQVKGDPYTPRYLAALGTKGDDVYILGGYGSTTGEQILNPKYLYDLLRFDPKANTIKKIFALDPPKDAFVFANSMVIIDENYYALTFPKDRFDSRLQLIRGSLKHNQYQALGDTIPYAFKDNRSYADLYYCANSKKLVAVTLLTDDNKTTDVKIYTIAFPPNALTIPAHSNAAVKVNWWYYPVGLLLLAFALWLSFRKRERKRRVKATLPEPEKVVKHKERPSVFLFGNFSVTDAEGVDITRQFTPLLKELFLLIMIYSVKYGHGISVENLNEILWNDKSDKDAKNNRSVNMLKLKTILGKLGNCSFKKESGKWVFQYPPEEIYIDLAIFYELVRNREGINKDQIRQLLQIVSRGAFLHQTEYTWLDDIKSDISGKVLDVLIYAGSTLTTPADAELLIEIANAIFNFDQVNEQALQMKCKTLNALGRHSIARNTYEKFAKDYRHMYDEDFPQSFSEILH
ncbi:kelch repeat-containing protein [Chitinophaga niabensis]|uniref:Two-component response regulator, SAPR family, consists of REC, wHTH and BTAD domains n=1 Tax=Chitinophaga niabensis TaxID=536979 RepID=A0A1N6D5B5_9BACT|nr:kelch repeat-containing protein [Chitinophaga niabensis]SIN65886.1 Two-component response regulator, SAPR family, consists of REC, wHTH and BTAD domains [Chitinophaga niabensis]